MRKKLIYGKMVVLSVLIIVVGIRCGKGGGVVTSAAKITVTSINPASIVYDGSQNPATKATITFSASGNPAPTVTVNNVPAANGQFVTPDLFSSELFTVKATNDLGSSETTASVQVSIHPTIAFLATGGWILKSKKINGVPYSFTCQEDDVTTFTVDGRWTTTLGTACPGTVRTGRFYLAENKSTIKDWGTDLHIDLLTASTLKVTGPDAGGGSVELIFEH